MITRRIKAKRSMNLATRVEIVTLAAGQVADVNFETHKEAENLAAAGVLEMADGQVVGFVLPPTWAVSPVMAPVAVPETPIDPIVSAEDTPPDTDEEAVPGDQEEATDDSDVESSETADDAETEAPAEVEVEKPKSRRSRRRLNLK